MYLSRGFWKYFELFSSEVSHKGALFLCFVLSFAPWLLVGVRGLEPPTPKLKVLCSSNWTTHPNIVEQKFLSSTLASSVQVPSLNIIIIAHLVRFVKRFFEIFQKKLSVTELSHNTQWGTLATPLPSWHYLLYTIYRKMSSSNFVQVLIWKFV